MIIWLNCVYIKTHLLYLLSMSTLLMIADGFTVKGSSDPLVVPLGGSVVLPCSVDSLLPLKDLEVEWRRSDSQTLIHLYQDGEIRPESQHQDYHDRAHFFTEDIKHGNFSLLLNNLTAEDEGHYTCKVYRGQESEETVVDIKHVERLVVSGSNKSISASVGDDVTLSCSVDSHIKPEEIEEVLWKKRDKDEDISVLLYQNNETLSESSDEQYRDRVEFFTDEIHRGNFSLRLKRVRTEDKGVYICQVINGRLSANTTVKLERLGFSGLHIMVLILCTTACGFAFLFCSLIYCRPNNTAIDSILHLQMCLVFCPNLIMFFAFISWGVSEGSVNETICCCALYFLRPLTLLWAAPYINYFQDKIKTLVMEYSYVAEYFILIAVVYSAIATSSWEKLLSYNALDRNFVLILYAVIFLCCCSKFIYILTAQIGNRRGRKIKIFENVAEMIFEIIPTIQFTSLFYTFGSARGGFIIFAILPGLLTLTTERMFVKCFYHFNWSHAVMRTVWLIVTIVLNAMTMGVYIFTQGYQTDPVGWGFVMMLLQMLWVVLKFTDKAVSKLLPDFYIELDFPRYISVYVFGSVVVVLINAVALITELTLKTVNGYGTVMDLRFIVFPCECFFIMSVMISGLLPSRIKTCLQCCQRAAGSDETPATATNQNTEENELNPQLSEALIQSHECNERITQNV